MKNTGRVRFWVVVFWLGVILVTLLPGVGSAIPQKINYQGYLTNPAGVPVSGTVSMVFSIYNTPSGGSSLWSETQSVVVTNGVYNVDLGSVTPIVLSFDVPYYLGVTVGADPEMVPRIALSGVGYAFRALTADTVVGSGSFTSPIVSTVSTGTAPLQVNSTTAVTNLNADLLDGQHASAFASSTHNHDLLPYAGSTASASTAFKVTNTGTGEAGAFAINNPANTQTVLSAWTVGTGNAGTFEIDNASNSQAALYVGTTGKGSAGHFRKDNASTPNPALFAETNGPGAAIHGYTASTTGFAGHFKTNNTSNPNAALNAETNGAGAAILGHTAGEGTAIHGYTSGTGNAGFFEIDNASNNQPALYAVTNGTGEAGHFEGNVTVTGTVAVTEALEVSGNVKAAKVIYSNPRIQYLTVGSEAFFPMGNLNYYNYGGCGGAYIMVGGAGTLVASVNLPQGAVVTEFKVFFYDISASDMVVILMKQFLSECGYDYMATVTSSGTAGYYSLSTTSIANNPIDNTQASYFVSAYSTAWDSEDLRIKGAVIKYTISEAP